MRRTVTGQIPRESAWEQRRQRRRPAKTARGDLRQSLVEDSRARDNRATAAGSTVSVSNSPSAASGNRYSSPASAESLGNYRDAELRGHQAGSCAGVRATSSRAATARIFRYASRQRPKRILCRGRFASARWALRRFEPLRLWLGQRLKADGTYEVQPNESFWRSPKSSTATARTSRRWRNTTAVRLRDGQLKVGQTILRRNWPNWKRSIRASARSRITAMCQSRRRIRWRA